jgi:hypothetical protein
MEIFNEKTLIRMMKLLIKNNLNFSKQLVFQGKRKSNANSVP